MAKKTGPDLSRLMGDVDVEGADTPAAPKRRQAAKGEKRKVTYTFDAGDEKEIVRLSSLLIGAGIPPRRIEESKVVRTALHVAFLKGVTPKKAAEIYESLMASDRRRTRR